MVGIDVKDAVVVITGASGNIGSAYSEAFLENGAKVANLDLYFSDRAKAIAEKYPNGYAFFHMDITRDESIAATVKAAAEHFCGIDILLNNAAVFDKEVIDDIKGGMMDHTYEINIRGVVLSTKYCIPYLKKSGRGRIINMSSMQASIGMESYTPYTAAKGAVSAMTRVWAAELAAHGVTANAILPGWVEPRSPHHILIERLAALHGLSDDDMRKEVWSYVPIRRWIKVEEVALTALFLASRLGGGVNGAEIQVDGGLCSCVKTGLCMKQPL